MTDEDWEKGYAKALGVFVSGEAIETPDEHGDRIIDDSFHLVINAHHEPVEYLVPGLPFGRRWVKVLDTHAAAHNGLDAREGHRPPIARRAADNNVHWDAGSRLRVAARSLLVLRREGAGDER
jgi:glycogen operon protein